MKTATALLLFLAVAATLLTPVAASDNGEPLIVVLFLFFGLGVGTLVMQVLSWIGEPVPYTCVVFIAGVIFSVFNKDNADIFGESIGQWTGINGELLLFVFLPPLIFGEAMSLNWYHVQGGLIQAIILAGPGVLVGAAAMGLVAKFMLPYNWSWTLAMEFGSILSATDPVAVVALLKAVGASPKLTILIVGESLLNDGTAMVLFAVFFNALNGTQYTVGSIIIFFLEAAIGSVVFGMAIGLITVRWLRSANRPLNSIDTTAQIAITLCSAYVTFFVAQYSLRVSGVLACCGAGIMLAWLAPPIILKHEVMHNVWGMVEWVMNTFIFMLAGLIIGHRVLAEVDAIDWLYMFVLYIILMVFRFGIVFLFYPLLSRIGHKCTFNEAIFMSWAGLRGALGMTLSLIVHEDTRESLEKETSRLFFYVGGIAALTLVINAPTSRHLLVYLGLVGGESAEKVLMMNHFKRQLKARMEKVLEQMAAEFGFTPQDLDEVRISCSRLTEFSNMEALYRDSERLSMFLKEHPDRSSIMGGVGGAGGDAYRDARIASQSNMDNELEGTHPASSLYAPGVGSGRGAGAIEEGKGPVGERHARLSSGAGVEGVSSIVRMNVATNDEDTQSQSLFAGETSSERSGSMPRKMSRSYSVTRHEQLHRKLSMRERGENPILTPELLSYVRSIFLEMVRVRYWRDIEHAKLPRLSFSAQFLLYSVEVGLDQVEEEAGTPDWACIEHEILRTPFVLRLMEFVEHYLPCGLNKYLSRRIALYEANREKRAVYMLHSFIEAHVQAQARIHAFIVAEQEVAQTPEEIKVINESKQAVTLAREMLAAMNPDTVAEIRSKQMAALVLAKEAELVHSMVEEGLMSAQFAQELLDEIGSDLERMEKDRNTMYRSQVKKERQRRQERKKEEYGARDTGTGGSLWKRSSAGDSSKGSGGGGGGGGDSKAGGGGDSPMENGVGERVLVQPLIGADDDDSSN